MQTASGEIGNAGQIRHPAAFSDKACASLAVTSGMLLVPCVYWTLETYGPSSRVIFYEYLPFWAGLNSLLAVVLGAWLGGRGFRVFRPQISFSNFRLMVGCLLGAVPGFLVVGFLLFTPFVPTIPAAAEIAIAVMVPAVGAWGCGTAIFRSSGPATQRQRGWLPSGIAAMIAVWLCYPQFSAFPSHGSIADREAWAQKHIPQFKALARTVEGIPVIKDSVGHVTAIAPASGVQHVTGLDMDGVAMRLVLDVKGERGAGTLSVRCIIDGDVVPDWQPAIWTMDEKKTEIEAVPNQVWRK
jgi:hypothetical protein